MTRIVLALGLVATLAACGVDGAPEKPVKSGATVSGTVKVGVGGTL